MTPISRDLYKREVDFAALALQFPSFAKKLSANGQLNFSDPESVRQLTKSLLKRDFGLDIELPDDRLCPPIPNRFNYILWIQDLIDSSRSDYMDGPGLEQDVVGIDIGTGASCIYPLLGCRSRQNWKFYATEVDVHSLEYAACNVQANSLGARIRLLQAQPSDPLLPLSILSSDFHTQRISFTTLNPPFYSSSGDMAFSASSKSRPPFSSCTGSESEMIYPPDPSIPDDPGGEISFVTRLLQQSMQDEWKYRIQWYTSLLGKLSSVSALIKRIKEAGAGNYAVTEFVQGNRTRRWGIAWSFLPLLPSEAACRGTEAIGRSLLPPKTEVILDSGSVESRLGTAISETIGKINECLIPLKVFGLTWSWDSALCTGIGKSTGNVWGRKARRGRKKIGAQEQKAPMEESSSGLGAEPLPSHLSRKIGIGDDPEAFVFRLSVRACTPHTYPMRRTGGMASENEKKIDLEEIEKANGQRNAVQVHIRRLRGRDPAVFESLCEMIRRTLI